MDKKLPTCKHCKTVGHFKFQCYEYLLQKANEKISKKYVARPSIGGDTTKASSTKPKPLKTSVNRRKEAIRQLDDVFSKYVRLKASVNGYVTCVTSNQTYRWQDCDAGHFIPRGNFGTRWDERNVHPQSIQDNRYGNGEPEKYEAFMLATYGQEVIDDLEKNKQRKWATYEIEEMLVEYKQRLKDLQGSI